MLAPIVVDNFLRVSTSPILGDKESAQTNTTASPTVRYGPNAPPHPSWALSLDASRAAGFYESLFSAWIRRIVADTGKSKLLRDTSLSQHRVGGMPRQDFPVHGETSLRDRTVPDFVVAFACPLEVTAMRAKNLLHARGVTGHQKVRTPRSSCWYSTWKLAVLSLVAPFNSNNSGISILSF